MLSSAFDLNYAGCVNARSFGIVLKGKTEKNDGRKKTHARKRAMSSSDPEKLMLKADKL